MGQHIGLLIDFRELQVLGQDAVQRLCNEWVRTLAARECGVEKVLIGDEGNGLDMLDLQIRIDFAPEPGFQEPKEIEIPFPVDNLLSYLIEHAIPIDRQAELKNRVALKRQNAPYVYRRYKTEKPKRLYIRCKTCRHILETQYSLLPQQKMGGTFDPFTCPDCGAEQPLAAEDFAFLEDVKGQT
jgi:hypothetical protein